MPNEFLLKKCHLGLETPAYGYREELSPMKNPGFKAGAGSLLTHLEHIYSFPILIPVVNETA
ncbi:MAG: hypothetical protein ACAH80_05775 [Alphaproteobacteria bacterium]